MEDDIQQILSDYTYSEKAVENSTLTSGNASNREHPLVFFFSTYYSFPTTPGLCRIMMYHDLIPEHVGYHHGPGSEYYPRIEALDWIDSIVSVSHSTTRDLIQTYGDKIRKMPSHPKYAEALLDADRETLGYIVSTTPNRISREQFPGRMPFDRIKDFRTKYGLWSSPFPPFQLEKEGALDVNPDNTNKLPIDYFVTVGASHSYKNTPSIFAAMDRLPDDVLAGISLLLIGRGHPGEEERAQVKQHPLLVESPGAEPQLHPARDTSSQSTVPVRVHVLGHIEDADLPCAYSGALALVYVSACEGFGLPVAEAITSGTLAILTNSSSLPEVGGPSSLYVQDPTQADQVRDQMLRVVSMTKERRRQRMEEGLKWVERYGGGSEAGLGHGWDEMARLIAQHIRGPKHRGSHCYQSHWKRKI